MKLYWDFEFTGLHQHTTPISLGIVADNDKTFYCEFTDFDSLDLDDWINDNIIKNLVLTATLTYDGQNTTVKGNKLEIRKYLLEWLEQFEHVELIGDVLAYDWVLLVDLLAEYEGTYPSLPDNVYYIPFDLATLFAVKHIDPDVNREEFAGMLDGKKHNSLWDAKVIKQCWEIASYGKFRCVVCKEYKMFGSQLSYGSNHDGEWVCGDCQHEVIDKAIKMKYLSYRSHKRLTAKLYQFYKTNPKLVELVRKMKNMKWVLK